MNKEVIEIIKNDNYFLIKSKETNTCETAIFYDNVDLHTTLRVDFTNVCITFILFEYFKGNKYSVQYQLYGNNFIQDKIKPILNQLRLALSENKRGCI